MATFHPGVVINELRHGRGEGRVGIRRGAQLLQTDHIVCRQYIPEGCERDTGNLRDLRRGLSCCQRGAREASAREASAREAEAELVDAVRCEIPAMLGRRAVSTG